MLVFLLILLTVYLLLETLEVTSVPFTFTLLILYPVSGVKVIVTDEPSFTVNVLVLLRIVVPSYEAEPFPVDFIDKLYVVGGMASNSTSTLVSLLMLLTVYLLLETLEVTSVPLTLTLFVSRS